jgi:TonB family protein
MRLTNVYRQTLTAFIFSATLTMRISAFCLVLLLSQAAHAQDTAWYGGASDDRPQKIRSITVRTDSGWRMTSYYVSGKISSISLFADDSCTIAKGNRVYYTTSGKISRRVHFDEGKASGDDTYYYDNGKVLATGVDRNGGPDGEWKAWYRNGKTAAVAVFAEGKQTGAIFYEPDGGEKKDNEPFFQESAYPGGTKALYDYLDKNLQYPASAIVYNVQGVVVLQFRVTKEGNTVDLEIIQPLDPALDKEALRVVGGMRPWEPARIGGIPIETYNRLPISFKQ